MYVQELLGTRHMHEYQRARNFLSLDSSIPPPLLINPFAPNALFLYPLKTSENVTVFCFQGVEKGCIGNKWANYLTLKRILNCLLDAT